MHFKLFGLFFLVEKLNEYPKIVNLLFFFCILKWCHRWQCNNELSEFKGWHQSCNLMSLTALSSLHFSDILSDKLYKREEEGWIEDVTQLFSPHSFYLMAVLLFHFCSSGHHFWCACPLKLLLKFMCMEWMGCFNKNYPIVVIGAGLILALSNSIFGYVDFNNCKDIILTNKTSKLSVGQSSWRSLTLFFPHVSNISPIWAAKF